MSREKNSSSCIFRGKKEGKYGKMATENGRARREQAKDVPAKQRGWGRQVTPELRGTETAGTGEGWWLTPNMADSSKNINTGKICPELKTLIKGNQK